MTGWFMKDKVAGGGWTVVGFLLLVSGSAFAAETLNDVLGKLSAAEGPKVEAMLAQQQKGLGCKDYKIRELVSVAGIRVPKNPTGADGWWTARFEGIACGHNVLGNVEFDMRDGPLKMAPLVPGETRADPVLQADVKKSFVMALARAKKVECKENLKIRDTKLIENPKKEGGPWREVWVATACKQDFGQVVTFLPNEKGVGFTMALPEAGIRNQEQGTRK